MIFLAALATAALLVVAGYAQYRVPFHTVGRGRIVATRGLLIVVGVAFGYVTSRYAETPLGMWLALFAGFGAVHVPAAIILFVKRAGGSGKS